MITKFTDCVIDFNRSLTPSVYLFAIKQIILTLALIHTPSSGVYKLLQVIADYASYIDLAQLYEHSDLDVAIQIMIMLVNVAFIVLSILQYWGICRSLLKYIWNIHYQLLSYLFIYASLQKLETLDIINCLVTLIIRILCMVYDLQLNQIQQSLCLSTVSDILLIVCFGIGGYAQLTELTQPLIQGMVIAYDTLQLSLYYVLQVQIYHDHKIQRLIIHLSCLRGLGVAFHFINIDSFLLMLLIGPIYFKLITVLYQYMILRMLNQAVVNLFNANIYQLLGYIQILNQMDQVQKSIAQFYMTCVFAEHTAKCILPSCFCSNIHKSMDHSDFIVQTQQNNKFNIHNVMMILIDSKITLHIYASVSNDVICEMIYALNRIEVLYGKHHLFKSLIRYSILRKFQLYNTEGIWNRINPSSLRRIAMQESIKQSLMDHVGGSSFDIRQYQEYCQVSQECFKMIASLCCKKKEILDLLLINTQNPQYFLLQNLSEPYVALAEQCEVLLTKLILLNPSSETTYRLSNIFSQCLWNREKEFRRLRQIMRRNRGTPMDWGNINEGVSSFVVAEYDRENLIITQHSSQFPSMLGESKDTSKSKYIGQPVENIIAGPAKDLHQSFVKRLINFGTPILLNNDFQSYFVRSSQGFLKEFNSVIRLGSSNSNLQFVTLFNEKDDSIPKLLYDEQGTLLEFSVSCTKTLKLDYALGKLLIQKLRMKTSQLKEIQKNTILLQSHCSMINLSLCIPQLGKSLKELQSGLILIPKTGLQIKSSQCIYSQLDQCDVIGFYKYFLKHPSKCYVFLATFQTHQYNYNDKYLIYNCLNIYACKQIRGNALKLMGLELMLKQNLNKYKVRLEYYTTSYTSFKTLQEFRKRINETVSISQNNSWVEDEFKVETEPQNVCPYPATQMIKHFPNNGMIQIMGDRDFDIDRLDDSDIKPILVQSSINQSHNSCDQILSSRLTQRVNDLLLTDRYQPQQQLQQVMITEQSDSELSDDQEEQMQLQLNMEDMPDWQIDEDIEYIRKKLKKQEKKQRDQQLKVNILASENHNQQQRSHFQVDQQSISVKTEETSNSALVTHIITNVLNSDPWQLKSLYVISIVLLITLIGLIIINLILVTENYHHMYLDSVNRSYPLILLQDINLMYIAIQKIALINIIDDQNGITELVDALNFYTHHSATEYIKESTYVNFGQTEYHDFLQEIDNQYVVIQSTFSDIDTSIVYEQFVERYFMVQYMMQIMLTIAETNYKDIQLLSQHESIITLNYPKLVSLCKNMINLTTTEVLDKIEFTLNYITIFLIIGLTSSIGFIIILGYQLYTIFEWRNNISRTYFLFQGIHQQIEDLGRHMLELKDIKDFQQLNHDLIKTDINHQYGRQEIIGLKSSQSQEDSTLKNRIFVRLLMLILFSLFPLLCYFIPFSIYVSQESYLAVEMNNLISQLGYTDLAFSSQLLYFLTKSISQFRSEYSETYMDEIDEVYSEFLKTASESEHFFIYELPFTEQYQNDEFKIIYAFANEDVCQLLQQPEYDGYYNMTADTTSCKSYIQGGLSEGYQRFISYSYQKLQGWTAEIDIDKLRSKQVITTDNEFNEIIITYTLIYPYIGYIKNQLLQTLESKNSDVIIVCYILTASCLISIIIIELVIFKVIFNTMKQITGVTKHLLLLFQKQYILRNKHLMQVLQKQIVKE